MRKKASSLTEAESLIRAKNRHRQVSNEAKERK